MKVYNAYININWTHTYIEAKDEEEAKQITKDNFFDNYDGLILEDSEIEIIEREE